MYTHQCKPVPDDVTALVEGIIQFLGSCSWGLKRGIYSDIKGALVLRKKSWEQYLIRQKRAEKDGNRELFFDYDRSIYRHAHYFERMNALLPSDMQVNPPTVASQQEQPTIITNDKLTFGRFTSLKLEGEQNDSELENVKHLTPLTQGKKSNANGENGFLDDANEFDMFCTAIKSDFDEILVLWLSLIEKKTKPFIAAASKQISTGLEKPLANIPFL
ncbi:hypothetical protein GCM10020218_103820 [Dactylosporangium vinaceum]